MLSPNHAVWKPLLVCPSAELARRLEQAFAAASLAPPVRVADYPEPGTLAALAPPGQANLCFLDMSSDEACALRLISEAAARMPVVAVNPRKDADLILTCLHRGATEFLSDTGPAALAEVLERLREGRDAHAPRTPGTVYCIVPGKPGCGASTIAVHLALQMRTAGKVLLVDADPLSASIGFMLRLKSEFHVADALRDWTRMDPDLWSRLVTSFSGMDVLLASEAPGLRLDMDRAAARALTAFWRDRYAVSVVDMPDLRSAVESGLAAQADQVLMITTNELSALHTTRRGMEYLDLSLPERGRLRLVVNRYTPALGPRREDLRAILQVDPFAVLSNDFEIVQNALLEGKPVPASSRFRNSLVALSEQLQGKTGPLKKRSAWAWLGGSRK